MPRNRPDRQSQCQFRDEAARCVFVDGHPGAHVCIRPRSSGVRIRGEGEIPDATYLWTPPSEPVRTAARTDAGLVTSEDVWGTWTVPMVRRLLEEMLEAGAAPPRDWPANFPRLRRETSAKGHAGRA